jgi:hypothetical protein
MKPQYHILKHHHHSSSGGSSFKETKEVYREIGYDMDELIASNSGFENTCAVRMSIALLKAGVIFNGRLMIKAGSLKGRSIEPGAIRLADELKRVWGKPLVLLGTSEQNLCYNSNDILRGLA